MWITAENQIELQMIRHGKTAGNLRKAYIGKTDEPLCPEGIEELMGRCNKGGYEEGRFLYSSPMRRCLESGEILFPHCEAVIVEDLRETDFGAFEGMNYTELSGNADYQAFIDSNGELPFPGGESKEEATERSLRGMQKMLQHAFHCLDGERDNRTVTALVHGGTIMATLSTWYGGNYYDYQVPNAGGYRCIVEAAPVGYRIIKLEKIE